MVLIDVWKVVLKLIMLEGIDVDICGFKLLIYCLVINFVEFNFLFRLLN